MRTILAVFLYAYSACAFASADCEVVKGLNFRREVCWAVKDGYGNFHPRPGVCHVTIEGAMKQKQALKAMGVCEVAGRCKITSDRMHTGRECWSVIDAFNRSYPGPVHCYLEIKSAADRVQGLEAQGLCD